MLLVSCVKEELERPPIVELTPIYERFSNGSYDMIFLTKGLAKNDHEFILAFEQRKLENAPAKDLGEMALNEAIFSLEGLANKNNCNALLRYTKKQVEFDFTLAVDEVSENGEVFVSEEEIYQKSDYLSSQIPVKEEGEVHLTIDLDVVSISEVLVSVKVKIASGDLYPPAGVVQWFQPGESYWAIGEEAMSQELTPGGLGNQQEQLPLPQTQPYPAWVHLNDKLNWYYGTLAGAGQGLYDYDECKDYYTNIQANPSDFWGGQSYADGVYCTLGRRGLVYMGGWNGVPFWDAPSYLPQTGCGCADAPEDDIPFPDSCSEYVLGTDQVLGYERMNIHLAKAIELIDRRLEVHQNLPNVSLASVRVVGWRYDTNWAGNVHIHTGHSYYPFIGSINKDTCYE